jgi:hypothetical protein
LRGSPNYIKRFGVLGATWEFFLMLPKRFGHSGVFPRKCFPGCSKIWELEKSQCSKRLGRIFFSRMLEKFRAVLKILSLPGKIL